MASVAPSAPDSDSALPDPSTAELGDATAASLNHALSSPLDAVTAPAALAVAPQPAPTAELADMTATIITSAPVAHGLDPTSDPQPDRTGLHPLPGDAAPALASETMPNAPQEPSESLGAPNPQSSAEPASENALEHAPEAISQPASELMPEHSPEPAQVPVPGPAVDPAAELTAEPSSAPAAEFSTELDPQLVQEAASHAEGEHRSEANAQAKIEIYPPKAESPPVLDDAAKPYDQQAVHDLDLESVAEAQAGNLKVEETVAAKPAADEATATEAKATEAKATEAKADGAKAGGPEAEKSNFDAPSVEAELDTKTQVPGADEFAPSEPSKLASEEPNSSPKGKKRDSGRGNSPTAVAGDENTTPKKKHKSADPRRTSSPRKSAPASVAADDTSASERPIPKNLPKVARNRPENARVFIGNLASEYTDIHEIVKVFHKYGTLIEEPVLRRSFGFVQYSTAESALKAVQQEQGRVIGGIAIDLSIADNREVKRGMHIANNTPFYKPIPGKTPGPMRGRPRTEREPDRDRGRKRRRSLSPASQARKGGVHPPQYGRRRPDPKNGIYLRILCMSPTAKSYAKHCENTFRTMTGLAAEVLSIVAAGLGEALGRAMRDVIPYVMVVASKDVEDGTCTIRTLEKTGYEKSGRGNGVIPLREAVEVCLIERGVIAPQSMGTNAPHGGASQGHGQWGGHGGNQNNGNHNQGGKPAWMSGPRNPHHGNPRMPPQNAMQPPQMMGNTPGPGGYGPYQSMQGSAPPRADSSYGRGGGPPPSNGYEGFDYNSDNGHQPASGVMNPSMGGPNSRERYGGEYDPTAVVPHRGPGANPGYSSNWNRDAPPMNRGENMYGNGERRHQPAVTRDRNGHGFHTVPPSQMYPGGSVPPMDRNSQQVNQGPDMYGNMPAGGYDARQNSYNQQYGGPPTAGMVPPPAAGGMIHGGMPQGGGADVMQHSGGALGGMAPQGGAGGAMGPNSANDRYGGYQGGMYGAQPMGNTVGNITMQHNTGNGYGGRMDRGANNGGSGYMNARQDGAAGSMGGNAVPSQAAPAPGTVDIGKLTNLISAFQQKQAAQQAQAHGMRGPPPQQGRYGQPPPRQQQQQQQQQPQGDPQQGYGYGSAPGAQMGGMGRQQHGYYG